MNEAKFNRVFNDLSRRRKEVLQKFLDGESDEVIALSLNIVESTVRKHIQEICDAFGLKNQPGERYPKRSDLIALFRQHKPELVKENHSAITSEAEAVKTVRIEDSGELSNSQDCSSKPDTNFVGREEAIARSLKSKPNGIEGRHTQGFALPEKLAPVRNWVGRSQELDTLKAQIFDPDTRAITITAVCVVGLAGIGKTTLASQLVRQLSAEKAPFVAAAWESLRSVTGKPPRFDGILDSLLLTLSNSEITPTITILDDYLKKTERLVKLLKDQSCLLVLDNVETVLKTKQAKRAGYFADDCTEYAWLFQQLAETEHQSKVIFTSRETLAQLQRRETHTLRLGGLDQEAAVKLLESFKLTTTSEELAKLAKRYDGHPKALEIVAALIQDDIEFEGRVGKFLEDTNWLLVNTLDELIEQVTNRLSNEELRCLSQISVYETPEYALSVTGIAAQMPEMSKRNVKENIIEALKRRQLLDYNRDNESYQMHPLVQEKASNLLNSESAYHTAHCQAYCYFLGVAKPEAEWKEFDDLKPLLRAHYHACQAQNWDEALAAISLAYEHLRQWGYFEWLIDLYSKLLPDNWQNGEQLVSSSNKHSEILLRLGNAYDDVSQWKTAYNYYQQGLSVARRIRDRKLEASVLCYMGLNNNGAGAGSKETLKYLQESLAIATKIGERQIEFKCLEYLGVICAGTGDYHQATEITNQSLIVARQISFEEGEARALGNLGYLYAEQGKHNLAIKYMEKKLEISTRLRDLKSQTNALNGLAQFYNRTGNYKSAIQFAQDSRTIARDLRDQHTESGALKELGVAYKGLGEYQTSINLLNKYLEIARAIGFRQSEADALYNMGVIYGELGQLEQAIEHLQSSWIIFQENGNRADEARALVELTKSSIRINTVSPEAIQDYLNQADQICKELKLPLLTEVQKMKAKLPASDK